MPGVLAAEAVLAVNCVMQELFNYQLTVETQVCMYSWMGFKLRLLQVGCYYL